MGGGGFYIFTRPMSRQKILIWTSHLRSAWGNGVGLQLWLSSEVRISYWYNFVLVVIHCVLMSLNMKVVISNSFRVTDFCVRWCMTLWRGRRNASSTVTSDWRKWWQHLGRQTFTLRPFKRASCGAATLVHYGHLSLSVTWPRALFTAAPASHDRAHCHCVQFPAVRSRLLIHHSLARPRTTSALCNFHVASSRRHEKSTPISAVSVRYAHVAHMPLKQHVHES